MKKYLIILILLLFVNSSFGQDKQLNSIAREQHYFTPSLNTTMRIDSIIIPKRAIVLKVLNEEVDNITSTPILTNQNLLSFKNKEWARKLVIDDYWSDFPQQGIIKIHNSKEFIKKANVKIHFTVYFMVNIKKYAFTYTEGQLSNKTAAHYGINVFKYIEGEWLLSDKQMFHSINDLAKIKPEFAKALVQGKEIKNNKKYNELFNLLYSNDILNLFNLNKIGVISKDNFKTILN